MFPLDGTDAPHDTEQLRRQLTGMLRGPFALPPGQEAVTTEGDFPDLRQLRLELTGATYDPRRMPPKPVAVGPRQSGLRAEELLMAGHPVRMGEGKLDLELRAHGAQFAFDRDRTGRPLLVLTGARDGTIRIAVSHQDLAGILLTGARDQAGRQGVQVDRIEVQTRSLGPRSLAIAVRVEARKGPFGATVRINGRLEIDPELNARLSGLSCTGEGLIGGLASGALQPHLTQLEGRSLALGAFGPGELRLRDIQLRAENGLEISAVFGAG